MNDPFVDVQEVRGIFPGDFPDGKVGPETVLNWIRQGVRLANGERLKLIAVKIGRKFCVRKSELEKFIAQLEEQTSAVA